MNGMMGPERVQQSDFRMDSQHDAEVSFDGPWPYTRPESNLQWGVHEEGYADLHLDNFYQRGQYAHGQANERFDHHKDHLYHHVRYADGPDHQRTDEELRNLYIQFERDGEEEGKQTVLTPIEDPNTYVNPKVARDGPRENASWGSGEEKRSDSVLRGMGAFKRRVLERATKNGKSGYEFLSLDMNCPAPEGEGQYHMTRFHSPHGNFTSFLALDDGARGASGDLRTSASNPLSPRFFDASAAALCYSPRLPSLVSSSPLMGSVKDPILPQLPPISSSEFLDSGGNSVRSPKDGQRSDQAFTSVSAPLARASEEHFASSCEGGKSSLDTMTMQNVASIAEGSTTPDSAQRKATERFSMVRGAASSARGRKRVGGVTRSEMSVHTMKRCKKSVSGATHEVDGPNSKKQLEKLSREQTSGRGLGTMKPSSKEAKGRRHRQGENNPDKPGTTSQMVVTADLAQQIEDERRRVTPKHSVKSSGSNFNLMSPVSRSGDGMVFVSRSQFEVAPILFSSSKLQHCATQYSPLVPPLLNNALVPLKAKLKKTTKKSSPKQSANKTQKVSSKDSTVQNSKGRTRGAIIYNPSAAILPGKTNQIDLQCTVVGCERVRQGRGLCTAHGGGRRCAIVGCLKVAQSGGKCKRHGGGPRCTVPKCGKSSQGGGRCRSHGGGKKCKIAGCSKGAQRDDLCASHGGHKKCDFPGCAKIDRGGGFCREHGRATRCQFEGCRKLARLRAACIPHAPLMYPEIAQAENLDLSKTKRSIIA